MIFRHDSEYVNICFVLILILVEPTHFLIEFFAHFCCFFGIIRSLFHNLQYIFDFLRNFGFNNILLVEFDFVRRYRKLVQNRYFFLTLLHLIFFLFNVYFSLTSIHHFVFFFFHFYCVYYILLSCQCYLPHIFYYHCNYTPKILI